MRTINSLPLFTALVALSIFPALAGSIDLSTGLDASNALLPAGGMQDAHWTVDGSAAQSVYPGNADWYFGWAANGPNSTWIAANANSASGNAATYVRTFNLTGLDLATVSLSGSWTLDDVGIIDLNGHTVASLSSGLWGALQPFSVAAGSGFFVPGINTLSISITQTDNHLEAVRLEGTVAGQPVVSSVPEPGTFVLLLGAVPLVAVARRRRS